MAKLTNVSCNYTGGGIYVCTAQYGDVYLASDLDSFGTYDVPWDDIEEKYDCDYDSHWKTSAEPLPTWAELLDAIRASYEEGVSTNMDFNEVRSILCAYHPDLRVRIGEKERTVEPTDDNTERLETICDFIECFEDFLDEKGIVIPNDEKDQNPESASNIYGTDYGILSDRIEELLIRYGVLKGRE